MDFRAKFYELPEQPSYIVLHSHFAYSECKSLRKCTSYDVRKYPFIIYLA